MFLNLVMYNIVRTWTDYVQRPAARNYRRLSKMGKVSQDFIKKQKNH